MINHLPLIQNTIYSRIHFFVIQIIVNMYLNKYFYLSLNILFIKNFGHTISF
jgi:hypothetical protein